MRVIHDDGKVEDINDFTSVISEEEAKENVIESEVVNVESYEDPNASDIEDNF